MSIMRTDEQIDALEILKSVVKTAHFYRAMSEQLAQEAVGDLLAEIAAKREAFVAPLEHVVKQLHELPAAPDADEEWLEELGGKIANFFSADSNAAVLDKCIEKDNALAELLKEAELGDKEPEFKRLIGELEGHVVETRERIRAAE